MKNLEEGLGYAFQQPELLVQALTHRSFAHEKNPALRRTDNERLEFLGDAVLNLILSRMIYERYPDLAEGKLSKLRAGLVNERQLKRLAEALELGDRLRLGKGEELTGGRKKASLLADALEALLGAVYLEGGYAEAYRVVERLYEPMLQTACQGRWPASDFKTDLQEVCQGMNRTTPVYDLVREEGPAHSKIFYVTVRVGPECIGRGRGKTKKGAEQAAARMALTQLQGQEDPPS